MVKKLKKMGYQINFKEVENFASGKNILRTHIAKALLNHKENKPKLSKTVKKELLVTNVLLALTSKGKKAYVPRKQMPIRTAIALIKQSGGISILSHPGTHKKDFKKNLSASFLKKLKKSGLNGIEALAGDHTASQNKYFFTLAKKLDFVISAGSDFHGRVHPKYKLGMLKAPSWVLPKLKKAIKSARTLHSSPSA
ncbi:MAG: hypothetical protein ACD_63C00221G0001 [uncultured bacterium]|nr:MAG: hypothetical protein ACD_63C00221G0001 [uncultured bacterium]